MPKSTLVLKSTVTRRSAADPVPSDMAERLQQLRDEEAAPYVVAPVESPAPEAEAESTPSQERPRNQRKREEQREANAVQAAFLAGNLGKPVAVFTLNGVRLVGRLRQFDQYCLLLEVPAPMLVFKHGISTIAPAR